ncbi:MAG TPA: hypothetical protein ENO16_00660 [Chromatiales bacterium]|nr:hypothetical protein [Chromatiales bacterium]
MGRGMLTAAARMATMCACTSAVRWYSAQSRMRRQVNVSAVCTGYASSTDIDEEYTMRTSLTAFVLAGAVLLLAACGQKGDLYISDTLAQKEGVAEKAER